MILVMQPFPPHVRLDKFSGVASMINNSLVDVQTLPMPP